MTNAEKIRQNIFDYIEEKELLKNCRGIVLGLSGGADSTCLLCILRDYIESSKSDISIMAVHVNHMIREEALRDEEFSRKLADKYHAEFKSVKFDVQMIAKERGLSVEETGRILRYESFEKERLNYGDDGIIAVAHHMNDQAETICMNMARGSSLSGLTGMKARNGAIIRPLLCITKSDIYELLDYYGETHVTDVTNEDNHYSRNRVRNCVIPELVKVNSKAVWHISNMAEDMSEIEDFINDETAKAYERICHSDYKDGDILSVRIDIKGLKSLSGVIRKNLLKRLLVDMSDSAKDVYRTHVKMLDELCESQVGSRIDLSNKLSAYRDYSCVRLFHNEKESSEITVLEEKNAGSSLPVMVDTSLITEEGITFPIDRLTYILGEGIVLIESVTLRKLKPGKIIDDNYTKCFDYATIGNKLKINTYLGDERIVIDRAGNSHRLKKDMVDGKLPKDLRSTVITLMKGDNSLDCLWALSLRRSVTDYVSADSEEMLMVRFNKSKSMFGGINMNDLIEINDSNISVLISEEMISKRLDEIAAEIDRKYAGERVMLVCVLKGSFIVFSELTKRLHVPVSIDFLQVSSYGNGTISSGNVVFKKDLDESINERNVILVEDIIDTGVTMSKLLPMLKERKPKNLEVMSLLSKPSRRKAEVNIDYLGFEIEDQFVIGYGLDYAEQYRNLPYIGVLQFN